MSAKQTLSRLSDVMQLTRRFGPTMTTQAFQIVLEIYLQPGITMRALAQETGLVDSSISRNLMALGDVHRGGRPGLRLVRTAPDPVEARRQIAFLTEAGKDFVHEVLSALSGGSDICTGADTLARIQGIRNQDSDGQRAVQAAAQ